MCIPKGVRYIISKIAFDCFKLCTKTVISRIGFSKDISKDKKKKKKRERHCHYINGTPDANLCSLDGIEMVSSAPALLVCTCVLGKLDVFSPSLCGR